MRRFTSRFPMLLMGVSFLVSQVLILREFLVSFRGNELTIGIVLGGWLLLEALGSRFAAGVGRKRAKTSLGPETAFARVQVAISFLLPATLVVIRIHRHLLGLSPWEAMSYAQVWLVSLLLPAPLAVANGIAFVRGCRVLGKGDEGGVGSPAAEAGTVYGLESAGAFLGGLLFTFVLVGRFPPIAAAFLLGALDMGGCGLLLLGPAAEAGAAREEDRAGPPGPPGSPAGGAMCRAPHRAGKPPSGGTASPARPWGTAACCVLAGALFVGGMVSPVGERLHRWSARQRWVPLALRETAESVYGNISVLGLADQEVFYQNGIPTITLPFPDTAGIEREVHIPMLAHEDPEEVLFLGGGVGGAIAEALKYPLRTLWYTELDPLLVWMVERHADPRVKGELGDSRVRLLYEDGRFFLRRSPLKFDVIFVRLPESATLQMNRYFTREFFLLAAAHLRPGGILSLTLPGSASYMGEELARMNRCVRDTLAEVFGHVRALPGRRTLFLASREVPVEDLTAELLAGRLARREIATAAVGAWSLADQMSPWRRQWLEDTLARVPGGRINRDFVPRLLFDTLAYRNAEVQPGLRGLFHRLAGARPAWLPLGLLGMNLPFLVWVMRRRDDRLPALAFAVFGSGFVGMTLELVVILAFQAVYGYLYLWIGMLIAAFMAGMAAGAFLATGWWRKQGWVHGRAYRAVILLEGAQLGFLVLAIGLLATVERVLGGTGAVRALPAVFLLVLNGVGGLLVGAEFPLATHQVERAEAGVRGRNRGEPAGRFYALDLAGAWLGTLLVGAFLVPLIGIPYTLLFAAGLKLCGLGYLWLCR